MSIIDEKEEKIILKGAVDKWGTDKQILMCAEESTELSLACIHWRRGKSNADDIIREAIDAEIMINQLKIVLDHPYKWRRFRRMALNRLRGKVFG